MIAEHIVNTDTNATTNPIIRPESAFLVFAATSITKNIVSSVEVIAIMYHVAKNESRGIFPVVSSSSLIASFTLLDLIM